MDNEQKKNMWAIIELMGHDITAGIITPGALGGLIRIDIPVENGWRTEFIGQNAIFRIRIVSEEISRAYAIPNQVIQSFDTPVIPRDEYEKALERSRIEIERLNYRIKILNNKLIAISDLDINDNLDSLPEI